MIDLLKTKSLRAWITLGMIAAFVPLLVSAGAGYYLLHRGVIAPFHHVAAQQRGKIAPAQQLRLLIWETIPSVDEWVEAANPVSPPTYRALKTRIEEGFAALGEALTDQPSEQALLERALDDWGAADRYATELISLARPTERVAVAETLQRFHGAAISANDRMTAVYERLAGSIDDDHDTALRFYERSLWVAGIAAAVSLLMMAFGVVVIGRILSNSVDRLVDGAIRFSEGERNHRIEIQVPPELHRVAEEFNHMIGRIHESEAALSEMARRDSLTGLSNRRAMDEAFRRAWTGMRRHAEPACLLALDIDHFKRTNDTYGHAAGDEVLRNIARIITQSVRPSDKVFRVGGEEFLVLLPGIEARHARTTAERIRSAVEATPTYFEGNRIEARVSIGLTEASENSEQKDVMRVADAALYRAKREGRNRVVVSCRDETAQPDAA
ncbi:diguanylate cyclase [Afifella sp. IM 167]|uniref:diguanylate cyclase n=1 Tax=Afifella sp. IM 167 TaxID=2033586 RepID=UPI001CCC484E|nr:diguanylate cyclase [Afifella sp. IM 167]MBZ8133197.1 hypothetical protein [Afifella sp. IM 167]